MPLKLEKMIRSFLLERNYIRISDNDACKKQHLLEIIKLKNEIYLRQKIVHIINSVLTLFLCSCVCKINRSFRASFVSFGKFPNQFAMFQGKKKVQ